MPGKFLGVSRLPDLAGVLGAFHQLLGRPVSAGPRWLRSVRMSNLRAAVILLPLLLLSAFAWWTWRNVQETGNERAERIVSALADHTHRVLDVQETMLKSALARVRGQATDQIAGDASLPPFLADSVAWHCRRPDDRRPRDETHPGLEFDLARRPRPRSRAPRGRPPIARASMWGR